MPAVGCAVPLSRNNVRVNCRGAIPGGGNVSCQREHFHLFIYLGATAVLAIGIPEAERHTFECADCGELRCVEPFGPRERPEAVEHVITPRANERGNTQVTGGQVS
jgi:hypothetical protein